MYGINKFNIIETKVSKKDEIKNKKITYKLESVSGLNEANVWLKIK